MCLFDDWQRRYKVSWEFPWDFAMLFGCGLCAVLSLQHQHRPLGGTVNGMGPRNLSFDHLIKIEWLITHVTAAGSYARVRYENLQRNWKVVGTIQAAFVGQFRRLLWFSEPVCDLETLCWAVKPYLGLFNENRVIDHKYNSNTLKILWTKPSHIAPTTCGHFILKGVWAFWRQRTVPISVIGLFQM